MKISKVEAFLVSCPLPEPMVLPFYGGVRTVLKRDAMYIRVTADNGLAGFAPGPAHERAAREIREVICPFLEGREPSAWPNFDFQGEFHSLTQGSHGISHFQVPPLEAYSCKIIDPAQGYRMLANPVS